MVQNHKYSKMKLFSFREPKPLFSCFEGYTKEHNIADLMEMTPDGGFEQAYHKLLEDVAASKNIPLKKFEDSADIGGGEWVHNELHVYTNWRKGKGGKYLAFTVRNMNTNEEEKLERVKVWIFYCVPLNKMAKSDVKERFNPVEGEVKFEEYYSNLQKTNNVSKTKKNLELTRIN